MTMRLIDAEALEEKIENLITRFKALGRKQVAEDYNFVLTVLSTAPTIEAKPVVHAHWVTDFDFDPEEEQEIYFHFCSKCKNELFGNKEDFKYCPYCGAQMDFSEEKDE